MFIVKAFFFPQPTNIWSKKSSELEAFGYGGPAHPELDDIDMGCAELSNERGPAFLHLKMDG